MEHATGPASSSSGSSRGDCLKDGQAKEAKHPYQKHPNNNNRGGGGVKRQRGVGATSAAPITNANLSVSAVLSACRKRYRANIEARAHEPKEPFGPNDPMHLDQNPHVWQVKQIRPDGSKPYKSLIDLPFTRVLSHGNSAAVSYKRRLGEDKTVIHWGQRKLLLMELEFLTQRADPERKQTVVYAGGAPGTHVKYLSELFPNLTFVLIDPAPFTVKPTRQIICRQELFSAATASEYAVLVPAPLFICDVRSSDWTAEGFDKTEAQCAYDMKIQMEWHDVMRPDSSLLKFRLPWKEGSTTYLDGELRFQPWAPITSSETRLWTPPRSKLEEVQEKKKEGGGEEEVKGAAAGRKPSNSPVRTYDNTRYTDEMYYHNTVRRVARYHHQVEGGEGIDHCYDCRAEVAILSEYLRNRKDTEVEELGAQISLMSREITAACTSGKRWRTLSTGNVDPKHRKRTIDKRQFINQKPAYSVPIMKS